MVLSATVVLAAGVGAVIAPMGASAHGAMMIPGSRSYFCYLDGQTTSGGIQPKNAACATAVAAGGTTPLYNWFAVLRSDGAGRMGGFIPDGQLCSGGKGGPYDFTAYNAARADWPATHLTAGATMEVQYNNWAPHPGTFTLYVTKDGYDPTKPLAWSDLESQPFSTAKDPKQVGSAGSEKGHYYWDAKLPTGKTGPHLIYSVWTRSDSTETFYGCSDVVFDGGNGNVTGVGTGSGGGSTSAPTSSASRSPSSSSTGHSHEPGEVTSGCAASVKTANSWSSGFQADITVTNQSDSPLSGWMVMVTLPDGQTVNQVWNGTVMTTETGIMVHNTDWNGSLAPNATATFGFLGTGAVPDSAALSCTAG